MPREAENAFAMPLEHAGDRFDGLEPGANGPGVPLSEEAVDGSPLAIRPQGAQRFLEGPRAADFEVQGLERREGRGVSVGEPLLVEEPQVFRPGQRRDVARAKKGALFLLAAVSTAVIMARMM